MIVQLVPIAALLLGGFAAFLARGLRSGPVALIAGLVAVVGLGLQFGFC